jgi:hypothetical protein
VSKTISAAKTTTTASARRIRISGVVLRRFGRGQGAPAAPGIVSLAAGMKRNAGDGRQLSKARRCRLGSGRYSMAFTSRQCRAKNRQPGENGCAIVPASIARD